MTAALLIALAAVAALLLRAVSLSGAVAGWMIAVALHQFAGWPGLLLLFLLFLLTAGSTALGYETKRVRGIEQEGEGRRSASQVAANSFVGLAFAILAVVTTMDRACTIAMAAAFATAACDTVSSEIGKAYGVRPRLVTTLSRVEAGSAGGITLTGTLSGLGAALLLALAAWILDLASGVGLFIVTAAAFTGALCESFLRATILGGRRLGSLANLINTLIGALLAFALYVLLGA